MNRLQSKCMFGSLVAHGLLLALVVVGSAFVNPTPPSEPAKSVHFFKDPQITDDATSGGGDPNAGPAAAAPALNQKPAAPQLPPPQDPIPVTPQQPVTTPPPTPPTTTVKVIPDTPKPVKPKKPRTNTPKPQKQIDDKPDKPTTPDKHSPPDPKKQKNDPVKLDNKPDKTEKPKDQIKVDLTAVKRATPDPAIQRRKEEQARKIEEARQRAEERRVAQQRAEEEYQEQLAAYNRAINNANAQAQKAAAEKLNAINKAVGNIHENISGSAMVEMPTGPGGAAFINYRDFIFSAYYRAWETPDERSGSQSVRVEVIVARDGRVMSAKIVDKSGNAALDKSVRQALDRVPRLPAFPVTTSDETRTFYINFQLDAKRQFG